MTIEIINEYAEAQPALPEGLTAEINRVAELCLQLEGVPNGCACLRLVNDEEIRRMNRETRGIDRATDVLSYPSIVYRQGTARDNLARLKKEYLPDSGRYFLGDFMISVPRAAEQAAEYGHSLLREMSYLTAHALFHLCGYDHVTQADKAKMRGMEKQAMEAAGLARTADEISDETLFQKACEALALSYSPYSHYAVGACLLTADGRLFQGANFENASYGATICAERCAASCAIAAGARVFSRIAIVGQDGPAWPCGICRQVLNEFSDNMDVLVGFPGGGYQKCKLAALLPESFGPEELGIKPR